MTGRVILSGCLPGSLVRLPDRRNVRAPPVCMSDTPTFASLLTQWSGGDLAEPPGCLHAPEGEPRRGRGAGVVHPRRVGGRAAVEPRHCRRSRCSKCTATSATAAAALGSSCGFGDAAVASDTIDVLKKLSPPFCGPLLAEFALHSPGVFSTQPPDFLHWASARPFNPVTMAR